MSRITGVRRLALAAALALAAGPLAAQEQQSDELRATHGDWQVRCAPGTEECVIAQTGKGPQGNDVLEVRVRKIEGAEGPDGREFPAAIQILTPTGVNLKAGVRVQVDASEVRGAAFETCAQNVCVVRELMSPEFLDEMKAGTSARITLFALPQREIGVDISLRGFTRAFNDINA